MELTVLGCGDAFGNGGRFNTSFLLSNDGECLLMDCGTTALLRLKHEKVPIENISTIVLSHFHGDHFGGVPFFLICSLFDQPRKRPLTIIGPSGVKDRVLALQDIMYPGTREKLANLDLKFVEFMSGKPLQVDDVVIQAYQMEHSPESMPHGYRISWKDKVVAFSGDTSMSPNLKLLAHGADVFICECNFMNGVNFGHLSYQELGGIIDEFECKQLWISHMNEEVFHSEDVQLNKLSDGLKLNF